VIDASTACPLVRNITLLPKQKPTVSIVREDEENSFGIRLNFRCNAPDGNPRQWTDPNAPANDRWLALRLFSDADDTNGDGVPDDPNNPSGSILFPTYGTEGTFPLQYLTVFIDMGNPEDPAETQNFMTYLYDANGRVEGYLVAIQGKILGRGDPNPLATFIKKFEVKRPAPAIEELLAETTESVDPTGLSGSAEVPIAVSMEVGTHEESKQVSFQTSFNAANMDPTLLALVDPNGNRSAGVDTGQDLDLTIEYKLKGDDPTIVIVDIGFQDPNGNAVEYNPTDPNTGERNPDAEPIILYVPLPKALQNVAYNANMTLAEIEALVAKDPEDFVLTGGVWKPKPGMYGIYFQDVSGQIEVFRPDASRGEGIEVMSQGDVLVARVSVTHTSQWFLEYIPLPVTPPKPVTPAKYPWWQDYYQFPIVPEQFVRNLVSQVTPYLYPQPLVTGYQWMQPSRFQMEYIYPGSTLVPKFQQIAYTRYQPLIAQFPSQISYYINLQRMLPYIYPSIYFSLSPQFYPQGPWFGNPSIQWWR